jgi:hypothetical protein
MTRSAFPLRHMARALLLIAAGALAGCETTGGAPAPQAAAVPQTSAEPQAPEPPAKPMTHTRAALECWMKTEKGRADINLDKRADIVTKCIDDKLKAAGTPRSS